jgi:glyceraldehyde-3-phosphate dehydrogenase (NAD(P))
MNVLVRGLGNIGTTIANLLLVHRELLGIERVAVHKRGVPPFDTPDLDHLQERGAVVHVGAESLDAAWAASDYVFDCRAAGAPRRERERYEHASHLVGACAQGTEEGFGVPFVGGTNDSVVAGAKLVQVASCNTHATTTLLRVISRDDISRVVEADFVVVRRSEDIGSHERLVSGTVVARHRDPEAGTHHASDARRVFATLGHHPAITSSDVTTPSQLLHTVRFAVRLRHVDREAVHARLEAEPRLATTDKFDANRLFELGRRYGPQGRLYSHAIVVRNNLMVSSDTVRGWAFVPQEGNTIASTLEAFVLRAAALRSAGLGSAALRSAALRPPAHGEATAPVDAIRAALFRALLRPRW